MMHTSASLDPLLQAAAGLPPRAQRWATSLERNDS